MSKSKLTRRCLYCARVTVLQRPGADAVLDQVLDIGGCRMRSRFGLTSRISRRKRLPLAVEQAFCPDSFHPGICEAMPWHYAWIFAGAGDATPIAFCGSRAGL